MTQLVPINFVPIRILSVMIYNLSQNVIGTALPSSSPILLHATNTTSFPSPSLPDLGPDPGIGVDVDVEGAVEYRGVGSCSGTSLAAQ